MALVSNDGQKLILKLVYFSDRSDLTRRNFAHLKLSDPHSFQPPRPDEPLAPENEAGYAFVPIELGEFDGRSVVIHLYSISSDAPFATLQELVFFGLDGLVWIIDPDVASLPRLIEAKDRLDALLKQQGEDPVPRLIQYIHSEHQHFPVDKLSDLINPTGAFEVVADLVSGQGVRDSFNHITRKILNSLTAP